MEQQELIQLITEVVRKEGKVGKGRRGSKGKTKQQILTLLYNRQKIKKGLLFKDIYAHICYQRGKLLIKCGVFKQIDDLMEEGLILRRHHRYRISGLYKPTNLLSLPLCSHLNHCVAYPTKCRDCEHNQNMKDFFQQRNGEKV